MLNFWCGFKNRWMRASIVVTCLLLLLTVSWNDPPNHEFIKNKHLTQMMRVNSLMVSQMMLYLFTITSFWTIVGKVMCPWLPVVWCLYNGGQDDVSMTTSSVVSVHWWARWCVHDYQQCGVCTLDGTVMCPWLPTVCCLYTSGQGYVSMTTSGVVSEYWRAR